MIKQNVKLKLNNLRLCEADEGDSPRYSEEYGDGVSVTVGNWNEIQVNPMTFRGRWAIAEFYGKHLRAF